MNQKCALVFACWVVAAASLTSYALPPKGASTPIELGDPTTPMTAALHWAPATAAAGPDLSSWRADGRRGSVRGRGGPLTEVTPLRGIALSAQVAGVTPRWCGARFQTGAAAAQSLVLIGAGVTEALSCSGIKAFGAVPAPRGIERIAFVYSGSSPNASGVTTVVIVDRISASASAVWMVNDELSYKLDQRGNLTSIPAISAYLATLNRR